jgi:hypothetical protein
MHCDGMLPRIGLRWESMFDLLVTCRNHALPCVAAGSRAIPVALTAAPRDGLCECAIDRVRGIDRGCVVHPAPARPEMRFHRRVRSRAVHLVASGDSTRGSVCR